MTTVVSLTVSITVALVSITTLVEWAGRGAHPVFCIAAVSVSVSALGEGTWRKPQPSEKAMTFMCRFCVC